MERYSRAAEVIFCLCLSIIVTCSLEFIDSAYHWPFSAVAAGGIAGMVYTAIAHSAFFHCRRRTEETDKEAE